MNRIEPIVTTDWLQERLDDPGVRILDIRGYVSTRPVGPGEEEATYRGAPEEYLVNHIPGAFFVDWTRDIVDPDDPVPAQLAGPDRFAAAMVAVGVGDDTHVVAVDHMGGQFAMRLWWALRAYGHDKVSVLEGGWNRWVEEERPVSPVVPAVPPASFTPRLQPGWRTTSDALLPRLRTEGFQLIDARDAGQYTGAKRRGPRGGHIPGAIHVPREIFFAEEGGFLPVEEVRRRLIERGVDPNAPTTAYCNGGVAATVVLFNLARLGNEAITNYDGSWNEWGPRTDLPLETGEG
jgi:thiosulfate/3-mercaptopyruvate sulfurtransferase